MEGTFWERGDGGFHRPPRRPHESGGGAGSGEKLRNWRNLEGGAWDSLREKKERERRMDDSDLSDSTPKAQATTENQTDWTASK